MALVGMLLRWLFGAFHGREAFEIFSTEDVWVETKGKRVGVALDGELAVMESPLHYRILPRSLNVLIPPPEDPPLTMTPVTVAESSAAVQPLLSPQQA